MARKKKPEEHVNHERWLVSYADFITLLFAFFVVMYSISSVNEGKYRVLSDSMVSAFKTSAKALDPVQIGKTSKSVASEIIAMPLAQQQQVSNIFAQEIEKQFIKQSTAAGREARAVLDKLGDQIENAMAPLIDDKLIDVRKGDLWLEVEIKSKVLFPSGSSILSASAKPVLTEIAEIFKTQPNPVHVEGYTDNVPINTIIYPSNWELATARAASVVRLFADRGVKPERMAAIGFGEYRPIGDNSTTEGRNKNRRVVLVVLAGSEGKHLLDIERRAPGFREKQLRDDSEPASPQIAPAVSDAQPAPEEAATVTPVAPPTPVNIAPVQIDIQNEESIEIITEPPVRETNQPKEPTAGRSPTPPAPAEPERLQPLQSPIILPFPTPAGPGGRQQ